MSHEDEVESEDYEEWGSVYTISHNVAIQYLGFTTHCGEDSYFHIIFPLIEKLSWIFTILGQYIHLYESINLTKSF